MLWEWHWTLELDLRLSEVSFYLFIYLLQKEFLVELDLVPSVLQRL
jgi:hypothetical protein